MTSVNGPRSGGEERAAMEAAKRQRQANRNQAHGNYAKKTDNEATKTKKAAQQKSAMVRKMGHAAGKVANGLFQSLKVDANTANAGKDIHGLAGVGESVEKFARGSERAAAEGARQAAKAGYKVAKKAVNGALAAGEAVTGAAADAKAYAKRKADGLKTKVANAADDVRTGLNKLGNWLEHAKKNIQRLGD